MRGVFRNIQVKRPCFRLGQISLRNSGSLFWRTTKNCRSQVPGLVPGSIPRHIAVTWILPRSLPAWRKQRKGPPNVADKIVALYNFKYQQTVYLCEQQALPILAS